MRYIATTAAVVALAGGIWLTRPEDPDRINPFVQEAAPLVSGILPVDQGLTLALENMGANQSPHVLLVVGLAQDQITALDLTAQGLTNKADFFEVIADLGVPELTALAEGAARGSESVPTVTRGFGALLPAAGTALRHVASGTNFPEHQQETNAQSVFNFPKFGPASPPVTTVVAPPETLLDYEVEICARFDRDIASLNDFDAAVKGFFLCGDFSDRAVLTRLIDVDNFDSGTGFSDAKSGPDRFPSGGLLVVPHDWQRFVDQERLTTFKNGVLRQDTRAEGMILNFRELVAQVLNDTVSTRFLYDDQQWNLVQDATIARDQVLMSGTSEGVIFMPPTQRQILRGALGYIASVGFIKDQTPFEYVVESFLREEKRSGRYLQSADTVVHVSSSMGMISVKVVAER